MSLFQKSVVNKYLAEIDYVILDKKYSDYKNYFGNPDIQANIRNSKEEQFQEGFLTSLFVNILGYTLNPSPNFNLISEKKNIVNSKKADGAILHGEEVVAVIELKATDTPDLASVENQAFGYKNNHPKCVYIITSNFEKLRFYIQNAVEFLEFDLFNLTKDQFSLMWLCLAKDNLLNDLPLKIKESSVMQEDSITKKLYADYSKFREVLFNNLLKNNPETDKLLLFKKTQKLLDRFLFIFFAEDRMLLPPNSISEIIRQWSALKEEMDEYFPLYDRFKKYFGYMNSGYKGKKYEIFPYNGGLFAPDEILDTIRIEDEILYEHTLKLSNYDFDTEVDVNILGHIFEHSLNEIEEIQSELEGKSTDANKSKRKKDGIFYTPKYITKYIVENTLGTLCSEKRIEFGLNDNEDIGKLKKTEKREWNQRIESYRKWLLELKICDPACGSGAFLNQALDFLLNEHKQLDELTASVLERDIVLSDIENSVLENNIFGVDINEEAVEIAKLSLWLKTAQKGRKLNSLSNNIKCGNSLIDDPAVAGDKAFNWQEEFPGVFKKNISEFHLVTFATKYSRIPFEEIKKEYNGVFVKLDDKEREILAECLVEKSNSLQFKILAAAILPDHVHLVIASIGKSLSKIMNEIKGYSAYKINEYRKRHKPNILKDVVAEQDTDAVHILKDVVAEHDSNYTIYGVGKNEVTHDNNYTLQGVGDGSHRVGDTTQGVGDGSHRVGDTTQGAGEKEDTTDSDAVHILKDVVAEHDSNYTIYGVGKDEVTPDSNYTIYGVGDATQGVGDKATIKEAEHIWARRYSNTFLDDDSHLQNAINYVNNNYEKHREKWGKLENEKIAHILKDVVAEYDSNYTIYGVGEKKVTPDSNYTLQGVGEESQGVGGRLLRVGDKNKFTYFSGGFDVVIGNPPYGAKIEDIKDETNETYLLFYKKGVHLLKKNGYLSYITPDSWLINENARFLRKLFLNEYSILSIKDVYKVFPDAPDVWCNIVVLKNVKVGQDIIISREKPYNFPFFQFKLPFGRLEQYQGNPWFIYINNEYNNIFVKMRRYDKLSIFCSIKRGFSPTPNDKNVTFTPQRRQVIGGEDIGRYIIKIQNPKYLIDEYSKSQESIEYVLDSDYIIIQRIRTNSLDLKSKWLISTFIKGKGVLPNDSVGYLIDFEKLKPLFILSLLNSNLLNVYYKFQYTDKNVKPVYLKELPIPNISPEAQLPFIEKADKMLTLNKELQEGKNAFIIFVKGEFNLDKINTKLEDWYTLPYDSFTKELEKLKVKLTSTQKFDLKPLFTREADKLLTIKKEIETTDQEIDQMVYKLYDLTPEEIKIVEG